MTNKAVSTVRPASRNCFVSTITAPDRILAAWQTQKQHLPGPRHRPEKHCEALSPWYRCNLTGTQRLAASPPRSTIGDVEQEVFVPCPWRGTDNNLGGTIKESISRNLFLPVVILQPLCQYPCEDRPNPATHWKDWIAQWQLFLKLQFMEKMCIRKTQSLTSHRTGIRESKRAETGGRPEEGLLAFKFSNNPLRATLKLLCKMIKERALTSVELKGLSWKLSFKYSSLHCGGLDSLGSNVSLDMQIPYDVDII